MFSGCIKLSVLQINCISMTLWFLNTQQKHLHAGLYQLGSASTVCNIASIKVLLHILANQFPKLDGLLSFLGTLKILTILKKYNYIIYSLNTKQACIMTITR